MSETFGPAQTSLLDTQRTGGFSGRDKGLPHRVDMETRQKQNSSFRREHREMEQESNVESAYRA